MEKILVTGVKGQLGYDVVKVLQQRNIPCVGVDIADFDVTDTSAVDAYFSIYKPTGVIHCAAYTAVDKAEDDCDRCHAINVKGTRNIALACKKQGAKMLYISTDYVFEGKGEEPYQTDDATNPQSVYGKTKLQGELEVRDILDNWFIVRISWVFGKNGNNFIKTMLRIGKEREEVTVVGDQIGSPTYTADLAPVLCDMIVTDKYGLYHATNEGYCSWADFAEEIFAQAHYPTKVKRITTDEYPVKAARPSNSRMSKESLQRNGFACLPEWKSALNRYLKELEV